MSMVKEEKEQSELPSKNEEFKFSKIQEMQRSEQSNNEKSLSKFADNQIEVRDSNKRSSEE